MRFAWFAWFVCFCMSCILWWGENTKMGQCFTVCAAAEATEEKQSRGGGNGGGGGGDGGSSSSSSFSRRFSTSKRFSLSSSPTSPSSSTASFSPFGLHSSCVSNATKQSLAFVKQQRAKLYIVRRCVTMLLLWHKYGKVWWAKVPNTGTHWKPSFLHPNNLGWSFFSSNPNCSRLGEGTCIYVCMLPCKDGDRRDMREDWVSFEGGFSAVEEEEPVLTMGARKKESPQTTKKPYMDLEHTAGLLGCFLPSFLPSQLSFCTQCVKHWKETSPVQ